MYLIAVVALFLAQPALAADWWSDFTNNLATDLAPFIALLGERPAQQFLSESTSVWDYAIFAMAPLGIVTTIVSTIRVGGGPSLRAFIGRAQEGQRQVEAELCSSTSDDVCEMYNNGGIARVFGKPKILELVVDPSTGDFEDRGELTRVSAERLSAMVSYSPLERADPFLVTHAKAGIFTFRDYEKTTRPETPPPEGVAQDDEREWKYRPHQGPLHKMRSLWYRLRVKLSSTQVLEPPSQKEPLFAPNPNLTLNIWMRQHSPLLLKTVAGTGLIIQLAVVLAATLVTYYFHLKKEDGPAAPYAAPLMAIGTMALTAGAFLSAYIIGESTHESIFERSKTPKTQLIVLQPGGQVIGDQNFEAFAYNDNGTTTTYVSSSKPPVSNQGNRGVYLGTILTAGGFILQFVGLRGLHSSVAVAQLGATVLMSAIRASLRTQRLSSSRNLLQGVPVQGHELDWLALHIGGRNVAVVEDGSTLTSESTPPGSPSRDVESKAANTGAPSPTQKDQDKSEFGNVVTSEFVDDRPFWRRWSRRRRDAPKTRRTDVSIRFLGMAREKPRLVLLPQLTRPDPDPRHLEPSKPEIMGSVTEPGFKDEDMPGPMSLAQRLVAYRARLARMTGAGAQEAMKSSGDMDGSNIKFTDYEKLPESAAGWSDDMVKVRETAHRLTSAIREMTDIIFSDDFELHGSWRYALCIRWPISCVISEDSREEEARPNTVYVTLRRSNPKAPWTLDPAHVEAILGLWLWSLKKDPSFASECSDNGETVVVNERIVGSPGGDMWGLLRGPHDPIASHEPYVKFPGIIKGRKGHLLSDIRNLWARPRIERNIPDTWRVDTDEPVTPLCGSQESPRAYRYFGWYTIPEMEQTTRVNMRHTNDDLQVLLAQEVMGCFLRAISGIISYITHRSLSHPGDPRVKHASLEKMKVCCVKHGLATSTDTASYVLLGIVDESQFEKSLHRRFRAGIYGWEHLFAYDSSFGYTTNQATLLFEKAENEGIDILEGLEAIIDQGDWELVLSHLQCVLWIRHGKFSRLITSSNAGAKGGHITAGHIRAALRAYGTFTKPDHWLMVLEIMKANPINLAAYLGLRAPLKTLLERLREEPGHQSSRIDPLELAVLRGHAEIVEDLAGSAHAPSYLDLTSALRQALREKKVDCVYPLATACMFVLVPSGRKDIRRSVENSPQLLGILDALWYHERGIKDELGYELERKE